MGTWKITKETFPSIIRTFGFNVEAEFKFSPNRKFKADWMVSDGKKMCLVEYEGIKGKSRHTSIGGYSKDCEKYNLAQILGFAVFRYTVLNFDSSIGDLNRFFGKSID